MTEPGWPHDPGAGSRREAGAADARQIEPGACIVGWVEGLVGGPTTATWSLRDWPGEDRILVLGNRALYAHLRHHVGSLVEIRRERTGCPGSARGVLRWAIRVLDPGGLSGVPGYDGE